ncbi:Tyrosine-protein kinase [Trema orientale]|uniref:Tyrosine-protein kinase n=1 Tax=Trema orientale TaxID=63057 RepID=A0A2P5EXE9_TREOI|nr:Tyrosine-protein kinase [Trema orientale]
MGWLENKEFKEQIQIGEEIDEEKNVNPTEEDKKEIKVTLNVLINATKKFSEATELGRGLLGTVYKAKVNDEITVAVKRLFPRYKGKINEFVKKEIFNLKSVHDKNLIRLWDVHIGEGLQLLVYEYMEKKSLGSALFDTKSELSWKDRFDICLGIAKGLKALHRRPRGKLVHGNIKTANILLNESYEAKLSDFGLANVYSEEDQFSFVKEETSKGYLAPEYFQGSDPTTESDIYSFGVVLLEIVCGQRNKVRKSNQETKFLLDKAHSYKDEKLLKLVDKRLDGDFVDKQALNILNLAVMCTDISPSVRPNISDVLSVLTGKKSIDDIRSRSVDASHVSSKTDASTSMEKGPEIDQFPQHFVEGKNNK